jgi:multiple sugar transport system substrate-binding protein
MSGRTAVVALLAVVVLAAGCGGGGGEKGGGTGGTGGTGGNSLTFWTAEDNHERVEATQAIVNRFERRSGIRVKLVAVAEDQLQSQLTSATAAGSGPDVLGALPLGFVHSLANDGLTDPDAAADVIDALGRETFSKRGLSLVQANGKPVAIPSDSWTQLLVYRKDLFDQAGLAAPRTFAAIRAAAAVLNGDGMAGIVAATKSGNLFTQQTFEYFALANNCQLTDPRGNVTLTSKACVDTFKFYIDLIRSASVTAQQDADTTRTAYLSGRAAMVIWSSFILDELAGLSNDALPSCPQCGGDRSFLARNSGIVTAIKGPDGSEPSQFGEVTAFAITKGPNQAAAERFVEFMMSDGYVDWLALAPEGKFPIRTGTREQPGKFTAAWNHLRTGVDRKEPLSEVYPPNVLDVLRRSTETMNRWGFPQGQGRLAGAQLETLPIPRALAAALAGRLDAVTAAEQAQADMEKIARSVQ